MSRASFLIPMVLIAFAGPTFAEERVLWTQVINVPAGQYVYLPVNVPLPLVNGRIAGSFQAAGGAGNEITFIVLGADAFKTYVSGGRYTADYTAERRRPM